MAKVMSSFPWKTKPGCTNCEWSKKNATVQRWYDPEDYKWKYYRQCSWCRGCFTALKEEYQEVE